MTLHSKIFLLKYTTLSVLDQPLMLASVQLPLVHPSPPSWPTLAPVINRTLLTTSLISLTRVVTDPDKTARFIALAQMFLAHERNSVPDPCSKICPRPPVNPQSQYLPSTRPCVYKPPCPYLMTRLLPLLLQVIYPKPESDNKGDGNPAPT
ncbi:hypothetical protein BASA60_011087 [Batrachochytrium salamandrivorans]|nr:hypothetical protein BASA60_011087 [Batrachochytrium salamandrivorans]